MIEIDAVISYRTLTSKMLSYFARSVANCFKYCEAERCVASDLDLLQQCCKNFLKTLADMHFNQRWTV